jgi:hypothetical protein
VKSDVRNVWRTVKAFQFSFRSDMFNVDFTKRNTCIFAQILLKMYCRGKCLKQEMYKNRNIQCPIHYLPKSLVFKINKMYVIPSQFHI